MARIEIYSNDSNVTLDDKVIGTDALDNSTKNFTVGAMLALSSAGTTYTAGTGIDITNNVISSTVVDTDTNKYVSAVNLVGTDLDLDFNDNSLLSVSLSSIADKTVSLIGTGGIAITGTYPRFTIDGSGISGGGGTVTGTGVANIMTKWITNTQIGNSIVVEDGNGVGIGIQTPAARLHVHNGVAPNSRLKLTTQISGAGAQEGLDIALVDGIAAQVWLYEPTIPLRFGTNNAERFRIDSAGQGWFQYGLRITGGIVDSNTTKGTNGQILSSDGSDVIWINAPAAGSTTLTGLTDTTISNPSVGDYLEYDGTAWVNRRSFRPESLILRIVSITDVPLNGQELTFEPLGQLVKEDSLHFNQVELSLASASEFQVVNECTAKVSLGAYIDNGNQSGQITFEIYENFPGSSTLLGSASFVMSNQAVSAIPTTFLSFFDLQPGANYVFKAYSTQHLMDILSGSFIQIEILK